jgi:type II secretion system protein H
MKEVAMRASSRHAGFTLTEVMVVTLVIGITMAASVPSFSRFMQSSNLDSASKQVAGHFRLARQSAVSEGVPQLVLWSNYTWYYLIRDNNRDGIYTSGEEYTGPYWLPKGIVVTNPQGFVGGSYISFSPNGTASQAVSFHLINDKGNTIGMTLLGPTGQVIIDKDA